MPISQITDVSHGWAQCTKNCYEYQIILKIFFLVFIVRPSHKYWSKDFINID